MNMKRVFISLLFPMVFTVGMASHAANAVVIDFDTVLVNSTVGSHTEDGYVLTSSGASVFISPNLTPTAGSQAIPLATFATASLIMVEENGNLFDLISLDLENLIGSSASFSAFAVIGIKSDSSTVTKSLSYTSPGLTTFNDFAAFIDLISVSFGPVESGNTGFVAIDNIVVEASASDVPEPGTLGLLGIGLFALGALRRRR